MSATKQKPLSLSISRKIEKKEEAQVPPPSCKYPFAHSKRDVLCLLDSNNELRRKGVQVTTWLLEERLEATVDMQAIARLVLEHLRIRELNYMQMTEQEQELLDVAEDGYHYPAQSFWRHSGVVTPSKANYKRALEVLAESR